MNTHLAKIQRHFMLLGRYVGVGVNWAQDGWDFRGAEERGHEYKYEDKIALGRVMRDDAEGLGIVIWRLVFFRLMIVVGIASGIRP